MTPKLYSSEEHNQPRDVLDTVVSYLSTLEQHTKTKWFWASHRFPLGIKPGTEADIFVADVFSYLEKHFNVQGRNGSGNRYEKGPLKSIMVMKATSEQITTAFNLVYYQEDIFAFISGVSDLPNHLQVVPWINAIEYAISQKGFASEQQWDAVIGIDYENGFGNLQLSAGTTIASVSLTPSDFDYEENIPSKTALGVYASSVWHPVVVSGSIKAHNWPTAQFLCQQHLHLLCALLSIQTNCFWSLRQSAVPAFPKLQLLPQTNENLKRTQLLRTSIYPAVVDTKQINDMWEICRASKETELIARAYYEALNLKEHPSFSLLAYVATIEKIGAIIFPEPPAEKCECCGRPKGSSAMSRFRKAIGLVLPQDHVNSVSNRLYKWRSGTAHTGITFREHADSKPLLDVYAARHVRGQGNCEKTLAYLARAKGIG
jgi:hypothetical protein